MRQECILQASIFDVLAEHDTGRELAGMSKCLDAQPELLDYVTGDFDLLACFIQY